MATEKRRNALSGSSKDDSIYKFPLPHQIGPSVKTILGEPFRKKCPLWKNFNLETGYNIRWKTQIPGLGISSPVIWGDKLFITTAISESDKAGFKPGLYGDVTPVKDSSVHEWKGFI